LAYRTWPITNIAQPYLQQFAKERILMLAVAKLYTSKLKIDLAFLLNQIRRMARLFQTGYCFNNI